MSISFQMPLSAPFLWYEEQCYSAPYRSARSISLKDISSIIPGYKSGSPPYHRITSLRAPEALSIRSANAIVSSRTFVLIDPLP